MSDNNKHLLLWIDTETTAIRPEDGQLLEIGMRITNLDGTSPHDSWDSRDPYKFSTVIPHSRINYTRDTAHAIHMHQNNGLLDEVLDKERPEKENIWLVESFDRLAAVSGGQHITLHPAGTNVDFDLAWLKAYNKSLFTSPMWNNGVSYRKLDLTTIRLTLNAIGVNPYGNGKEKPTHRVDDCLNRDIRDWQQWWEWVKSRELLDDNGLTKIEGLSPLLKRSLCERFGSKENA